MLICVNIIAQEPFATKEWQEITCDGINEIDCDNMWSYQENSNCYIFKTIIDGIEGYLYKFTPNKQNATLEQVGFTSGMPVSYKPGVKGDYIYATALWNDGIVGIIIWQANWIQQNDPTGYATQSDSWSGSLFIMDNVFYLLADKAKGTLMQIELDNTTPGPANLWTIQLKKEYSLSSSPKQYTSIVTLNNTVYYFNEQGFCSAKISGDKAVNEQISSVSVTDETSKLVTDNNSRIWIINSTDGVVEYNTKKNTATTITTLPTSRLSNRELDVTKACFYSDNYLYLITAGKAYSLDTTQQDDPDNPDDPDDPDNPQKPHDQSGHRLLECGFLGIEFVLVLLSVFVLRRKH